MYPDLDPIALQEPQECRLKRLTDIEAYLLAEAKFAKGLQKSETIQYNHKHCGYKSKTSTAINGEVSIAIFERGVGWLVGIALSGASPLFSLVAAIARISFQLFTRKQ